MFFSLIQILKLASYLIRALDTSVAGYAPRSMYQRYKPYVLPHLLFVSPPGSLIFSQYCMTNHASVEADIFYSSWFEFWSLQYPVPRKVALLMLALTVVFLQ